MTIVRLHADDATATREDARVAVERAAERALVPGGVFLRDDAALRRELQVIVQVAHALVERGPFAVLPSHVWTPSAPTLLTALRRELLDAASNGALDVHELVPYLRAIETIADIVSNDAALRFTNQFAGADALTLLVEVAHDMASPLSAILFLVERLQHGGSGSVTPAQERHLALVYSAAFGLSSMTRDMMELARGGARLLDEAPKTFSVADVMRGVRDLVQPLAEEKRLSVRFSGPAADRRVGQPAALSRILLNLTTNAFKFTTVGSVTVLVEEAAPEGWLRFSVEDSGRGIPDGELADIFSAFTKRDADARITFSSTGMGLAICHKLVSAMGGTLSAESTPGKGTTFSFVLSLPRAA